MITAHPTPNRTPASFPLLLRHNLQHIIHRPPHSLYIFPHLPEHPPQHDLNHNPPHHYQHHHRPHYDQHDAPHIRRPILLPPPRCQPNPHSQHPQRYHPGQHCHHLQSRHHASNLLASSRPLIVSHIPAVEVS